MISMTARYALLALLQLARAPSDLLSARCVSEAAHVPLCYIGKVLGTLVRAGLVTSQRGLNGGYRLARRLDDVSVLDVVLAVDHLSLPVPCASGVDPAAANACPLHRRLEEALAQIGAALAGMKLSALADEPGPGSTRDAAEP